MVTAYAINASARCIQGDPMDWLQASLLDVEGDGSLWSKRLLCGLVLDELNL
jgi:hypothetical protein